MDDPQKQKKQKSQERTALLREINDAVTRVSRLSDPDLDYIAELQKFKQAVATATDQELETFDALWRDIDPRPTP